MEKKKTVKKTESVEKTANAVNTPSKDDQVYANSVEKNIPQSQGGGLISPNKLIQAGAHVGLSNWKWNPKMKPYIYKVSKKEKSQYHIIDLVKSLSFLKRAYDFLQDITNAGEKVLIVGTRGKILKELIAEEAKRSESYYVNQRWLGGTLTNFKIINKSIKKMNDNLKAIEDGSINNYTKKEQLLIQKQTDKLVKFYGGIRTMRKLPTAIIVLDPVNDVNAIKEARKLKIPVIALANTNADPELIDFIVPINNSSIKSVALVLNILIDAITSVKGEPTKVVGKNEDEIILIEKPIKKMKTNLHHKKYSKHN